MSGYSLCVIGVTSQRESGQRGPGTNQASVSLNVACLDLVFNLHSRLPIERKLSAQYSIRQFGLPEVERTES